MKHEIEMMRAMLERMLGNGCIHPLLIAEDGTEEWDVVTKEGNHIYMAFDHGVLVELEPN